MSVPQISSAHFNGDNVVRSLLKWVGSKLKLTHILAPAIIDELAAMQGRSVGSRLQYIEPFAGTGIVGLSVLGAMVKILGDTSNESDLPEFHFFDKNAALVEFMNVVTLFQSFAEDDISAYNSESSMEVKSEMFLKWRGDFNRLNAGYASGVNERRAVLFWLLNQAGFNGLYRVNGSGIYNVPFGKRVKLPVLCQGSEFYSRREQLRLVLNSNLCRGFKNIPRYTGIDSYVGATAWDTHVTSPESTFVYCDPPYMTGEGKENAHTAYTAGGWSQFDLNTLCWSLMRLHHEGMRWMLSNSDAIIPLIDRLFGETLGKELFVYKIDVRRSVAANAQARGETCEVIITNFDSDFLRTTCEVVTRN